MRTIAGALGVVLASGLAAQAAPPPKTAVMAPIHQFMDSFNKGDIAKAEAAHTSSPTIIDEVPPHHWEGAGSFRAWAGDLDKATKAAGDTDQKVTLGQVVRTEVSGDTGYAVVKATFSYKEKGKAMSEPAEMVFALRKEGADWKIAGWAWSGTPPRAAAAKPAAKPATPAPKPKS